jgi:type I restriction enzyme, S subunit
MSKAIPKLRFKEFKEGWYINKLNEIAEINPSNKKLPDRFVYIDLESVVKGQLLKETEISKIGSPSRAQRYLQKNDILFQMVRPYQMNNLFFEKGSNYVASTGYAQIRTKENSRFVYQYLHLQKFVDDVIERCTGTSYPSINSSDLGNIHIKYPTLPEQQKIATFLSAVDEKIQQLTRKKELLEHYKKGVMQQLFSGKLWFKDENGKAYPKWEERLYEDIFSFYTTNSFSRENLNYEAGKVKNIHYGDIHTKFSSRFEVNEEVVPYINAYVDLSKVKEENYCQEGDLVIADASEDYADIGKTIEVIKLNNEKVVAGLHTFLARPNKAKMHKGFSGYLVQAPYVRKQVMTIAQGTKVLSLSPGRLGKVKLQIPCLEEQQKIASYLTSLDTKIESVATQIAQSQTFKKGLLQQMFV